MKFSELVRLLEKNGFKIVKEKGYIRYYEKSGCKNLIRIDYHGSKEIPKGTLCAIIKASGISIIQKE
ncbi:MAG: type II toxin-antitoxin system HicA family toxin [Actinobacteria bacterium]|nr:type II toxin-antitoxin system HicA family toxin [Actinomycetota bacterium]MBM3712154.1 type II toxin-antitoxin system HicA family toxin [Actinomycetota bacterium]